MREIVFEFNNQSATDSKIVAEKFGVSHNNVMKKN